MPYVKKPIAISTAKSLKNAVRYILDEAKTVTNITDQSSDFPFVVSEGRLKKKLVSGHLISNVSQAAEEFILTKKLADQRLGRTDKSDLVTGKGVLARHIIQSFSPDDNLTPEEIHEIGRKTMLEFTGGNYEFVIATHVDQEHVHNHIILNTTDEVSLKKHRWRKNTLQQLKQISDRHADIAGAKIIDRTATRMSHTKYAAYRQKNVYKIELKERLHFLKLNSSSMKDFEAKAAELQVAVDFSGKYAKYKLLDKDQKYYTRDRVLSKRGAYSFESICDFVNLFRNRETCSLEEVKSLFEKKQAEKSESFEMRLQIEPWQVHEETLTGIYLEIDFGVRNHGLIKIPFRYIDKLENGNYELFINRGDFFYFLNPDKSENNRFIKGETLLKQLAYNNGEYILTKNKNISRLDQLISEFEFLTKHDITTGEQFEELEQRFIDQLEQADETLELIEQRLKKLNKAAAALKDFQADSSHHQKAAKGILKNLGFPLTTKLEELEKEIVEATVEYTGLKERVEEITGSYKEYTEVKDNNNIRREQEQENSL